MKREEIILVLSLVIIVLINGIIGYFGMFVKRSNHFQTLCAMVNLMKTRPKKIELMTPSVPPIKYKCGNKIRN